jgi:hypothetical protein
MARKSEVTLTDLATPDVGLWAQSGHTETICYLSAFGCGHVASEQYAHTLARALWGVSWMMRFAKGLTGIARNWPSEELETRRDDLSVAEQSSHALPSPAGGKLAHRLLIETVLISSDPAGD